MMTPTGKRWVKGQSGNPGGRPKAIREVAAAAREHTLDAVTTLVTIMKDTKATASARVSAAAELLNRGWGKAPQTIELRNLDPQTATDEQLIAIALGNDAEPATNGGVGIAEAPIDPPIPH